MQAKTLTLLTLAAVLLAVLGCGGATTPAPDATPAEASAQPAAAVQTAASAETLEHPPAAAMPEATSPPGHTWEEAPCPMNLPPGTVEGKHITCGYVTVPEVRAPSGEGGPGSNTIRLAVAVIHSASNEPAPDPLVMLAGGPGQSALSSFVQILAAPGMDGFWEDREIVLVEQRGTRYSEPFLQCEEIHRLELDLLDEDPADEEQEALRLGAWTACRERFAGSGVDLAAYNSVENAADIVAVTDALGYDQVNLYGGSYGSLLAQHIMRDYPQRVRSAVLDAVSPLRHKPNMLYKAHATDRALRLLFTRCEEDTDCNATYPDLEQVYFDLVDRLNVDPATLQLQNLETGEIHDLLLTGDRLLAQTRDLLYLTAVLPDLPGAIYDMAAGDFSLLELIQSQFMFQLNLANGMYTSVVCSELADFTRSDMADPEGLYPELADVVEDLIDEVMLQPCQVWGVDYLGDQVTESVAGDVPTLFLSGEFDPTVPPHLAEVASEKLSSAYLYTFPGVGHSLLSTSPCAHAMMLAFLNDPTQAPDASCLEEMPGLAFRFPMAEVALEPFTDEQRGFSGLVPMGWQEQAPANLVRDSSAISTAYFVLEAQPVSADELFGALAGNLGLDPQPEPTGSAEIGSFTWDLYAFQVQGLPVDLALAEDGDRAYFVLLLSPSDERETLYEQLFLPAVEAMAPL